MRTAYHEQLAALTDQLGEMCGLAGRGDGARDAGPAASRSGAGRTGHHRPRPDRGDEPAGRRGRLRAAGVAGARRRGPSCHRQLDPDRRRRRPDGRAGAARRQDRSAPPSAARTARRGQRLLRRNGQGRSRFGQQRAGGAGHSGSREGRPYPRRRRRDGRPAPPPVLGADGPRVEARRDRGRRRHAA